MRRLIRMRGNRKYSRSSTVYSRMSETNTKAADLFVALSTGNADVVRTAIERGADVDCIMRKTRPLHFAICNKRLEVTRLLLAKGAQVNARSTYWNHMSEPPLVAACRMNLSPYVDLLLARPDLDLDLDDFFGRNALYYAIRIGNVDVARNLLDHGASICNVLIRPLTPRCPKMYRLLMERGYEVDISFLHTFIRIDHYESFQLGLRATPPENVQNVIKKWPVWKNETVFAKWLTEHERLRDAYPMSLKDSSVAVIRSKLIKNCKNIDRKILDCLKIPNVIKDQLMLIS